MAISWTHTVEDRLKRLERQQDRMHQRMQGLAKLLSTPRRYAESPPLSGGSAAAAGAEELESPDPPARGEAEVSMARPPLEFWVPPPIEGGQPLLNDRAEIKTRVETLTGSVRQLSETVQRVEAIVGLLGQVVYIAVDPQGYSPARLTQAASAPGFGGNGGSHGNETGAPALGGLGGLVGGLGNLGNLGGLSGLTGLLSGLLGNGLTIGGNSETGNSSGAESDAAEDRGDGGGTIVGSSSQGSLVTSATPALPPEFQQVTALLPLLEKAFGGRTGTNSRMSMLSTVLSSPAFHQLVGLLQQGGQPGGSR